MKTYEINYSAASFAIAFNKTWKNWLFYGLFISFIVSISILFCMASNKDENTVYRLVSPYGSQTYKKYENRPYIDYQSHFLKGDTDVYISYGIVYKVFKIR